MFNSSRKLYIARHGERLDFVDGSWRKDAAFPDDPPLTSRGEKQASELSMFLSSCNITSVYASPFIRTARTARLAAPNAMLRFEPGLCERLSSVRYWQTEQGPLWRDIDELTKEINAVGHVDVQYEPVKKHDFNLTGYPESTEDMQKRCFDVVKHILENDETHGNILVVGHISSVKGVINAVIPGSISMKVVPYCSITECIPTEEQPGEYHLGLLCDNSFHSEEALTPMSSEFSGGFGRTKYILKMAVGLLVSYTKASSMSTPNTSTDTDDQTDTNSVGDQNNNEEQQDKTTN